MPPIRNYDQEKERRRLRIERVNAAIKTNQHQYVELPLELSCKTCKNQGRQCYVPRNIRYPNGNAGEPCACCYQANCSLYYSRYGPSRRKLQYWLVRQAPSESTRSASHTASDLPQAVAPATKSTTIDHGQANASSHHDPATVIPGPDTRSPGEEASSGSSFQHFTPVTTNPRSSSAGTTTPPTAQAEQNSNGPSLKSSRHESESTPGNLNLTPPMAGRLDTANAFGMSSDELLNGALQDTTFQDLISGLVKHHESVVKNRDSATSANNNNKVNFEKNRDIIKGLQDEKAKLEEKNRALAEERRIAATGLSICERHRTEQADLIKEMQAERKEFGEEYQSMVKDMVKERHAISRLATDNISIAETRYTNLKVKHQETESVLATTQQLLKRAEEAVDQSHQAAIEREKEQAGQEEKRKERMAIELEMENQKEARRRMLETLTARLAETDAQRIATKHQNDKGKETMQTQMKELENRLLDSEKDKKSMDIAIKAMKIRLEEMGKLRGKTTSAIENANVFRNERNQAQAELAIAEITIQNLRNEQKRRSGHAEKSTVERELATLRSNQEMLKTDNARLQTEIEAVKKQKAESEHKLQVSEYSLTGLKKIEKELVVAKAMAMNYVDQRDEARNLLLLSDKAKDELKINHRMKSDEMHRLYAEIRKLKREPASEGKGSRANSGDIGEVEALIDVSMGE